MNINGQLRDYWDLSVKERANLTAEELEYYERVELAMVGEVVPPPPELEEVIEPTIPSETFYTVTGGSFNTDVVFDTPEKAEAFRRLAPMLIHRRRWDTGQDYVAPYDEDARVVPVEAMTKANHTIMAADLKEAKSRNEEAQRRYEKAREKAGDALRALRKDYRHCIEEEARLQHVRSTYLEYQALSGGDLDVARAFLVRSFGALDVQDALELSAEELGASLEKARGRIRAPKEEPAEATATDDGPF